MQIIELNGRFAVYEMYKTDYISVNDCPDLRVFMVGTVWFRLVQVREKEEGGTDKGRSCRFQKRGKRVVLGEGRG